MSSVLAAKSTGVGCLDSIIMGASQLDSGDFQSSQFDGLGQPPQGMTLATVHRKTTTQAHADKQRSGFSPVRDQLPPAEAERLRAMSWGPPSFFSWARAGLGSKQRRRRAS